jgi:hypothetical protein
MGNILVYEVANQFLAVGTRYIGQIVNEVTGYLGERESDLPTMERSGIRRPTVTTFPSSLPLR